MKDPLNLDFPDEITVRLDGRLREGLRRVADLFPHQSDPDLLALVLRRGLVAMLQELNHQPSPAEIAENRNAAQQRARELESVRATSASKQTALAQSSDPNRVPFGMKCTLHEQHVMDAEYDRETAKMKRDLGLADFESENDRQKHPGQVSIPHIERYIGLPVGEKLRQDLEDALADHDDLSEEIFLASLLDLGLRTLHEKPEALDPEKVNDDLRTWVKAAARRKFKAEWRALCNMVANGYR